MTKGRDCIVYQKDDGTWVNKRIDAEKASSTHKKQNGAIEAGKEMLKKQVAASSLSRVWTGKSGAKTP